MNAHRRLFEIVAPVIDILPDDRLKDTLNQSFQQSHDAVQKIETCFRTLPERKWTAAMMATFFHSWKASHLKMLAIYGLSCRLQRLALASNGKEREQFFLASAHNAATSHEDLGIDYNGETHAELYDRFAAAFLSDSTWQLETYGLPEARAFKQWVYRNMVVEEIERGLLTNLFSEIYNHGEYSLALDAFSSLIENRHHFSPEQRAQALLYISVHVDDNTEVDHFLVVVEALRRYHETVGRAINYEEAGHLFTEYLARLGAMMHSLTELMRAEQSPTSPNAYRQVS